MANRYAVATGNWSNPAIWDGGTLPSSGDDVRANGFTVTIDQDITVLSIRTDAASPAVAGGGFSCSTNRNITCNIIAGQNSNCLTITGSATQTIIGDQYAGGPASAARHGIISTSTGIINVTGNQFGGSISIGGVGSSGIINNSTGTINITGNQLGGFGAGVASPGVYNNSSGTINITGTATAGVSAHGIVNGSSGIINITKIMANNIASVLVYGAANFSAAGIINVEEIQFGINGETPISGLFKFVNSSPKVTVRTQSGTNLTLTDPSTTNPPIESNVRLGTSYGGGAFIGLLAVPSPSQVSVGIATDNTFGTGILTSNDFLNAIITSTDPVAERLRNVATVQTVGDQFNSFGKEP